MYFIVKKDSETGLKIKELYLRRGEISKVVWDFIDSVGGSAARTYNHSFAGDLAAVVFENGEPDKKIWKKSARGVNAYTPRRNNKEGKALGEQWDALPSMSFRELNSIVGWDSVFGNVGIIPDSNPDYYGVEFPESALKEADIPQDLQEVTYSKYQEMMSKEQESNGEG